MNEPNSEELDLFTELKEQLEQLRSDKAKEDMLRKWEEGRVDRKVIYELKIHLLHEKTRQLSESEVREASRAMTLELCPGDVIGDKYELVIRLGAGGMGEVWKANQRMSAGKPKPVALKFIRPWKSRGISDEDIANFRKEIQSLAALDDNRNIVKFLEDGVYCDAISRLKLPYYAMELINGAPITSHAKDYSLNLADCLDLFAQVCDGVWHVHKAAKLHLDLKPDNILVDEHRHPRITDFGLARALEDAKPFIGTPQYMSPEQVDPAQFGRPSEASDQYALGLILYELITGTFPYDLPSKAWVQAITSSEPDLKKIPESLQEIVKKALTKDPKDPKGRYKHVNALADAVHRYLRNPDPPRERSVPPSRPPSSSHSQITLLERDFLFPSVDASRSMVIFSGVGAQPTEIIQSSFKTDGAVPLATQHILQLALRAGIDITNIRNLPAGRVPPERDAKRDYTFSVASPAVNRNTQAVLRDALSCMGDRDVPFEFLTDGYPGKPVRLRIQKEITTEDHRTDRWESKGADYVLTPWISDNGQEGEDYGLVLRVLTRHKAQPRLQMAIAGCRIYGTWAAYLAAMHDDLLRKILDQLNFDRAKLAEPSVTWFLVKGIGHNSIVDPSNVTLIAGGVTWLEIGGSKRVRDCLVKPIEDETGSKYLRIRTVTVSNVYENGKHSAPYPVSIVIKPGFDSVGVVLYRIIHGELQVGILSSLKPVLFLRAQVGAHEERAKRFLSFDGIVAGALENSEAQSAESINARAAKEAREETGVDVDDRKMIDLGHYFTSPGYTLEKMYLRAYEVTDSPNQPIRGDGTAFEDNLELRFEHAADVLERCGKEIEDGKTEIAVRRLCQYLGYIPELRKWKKDV